MALMLVCWAPAPRHYHPRITKEFTTMINFIRIRPLEFSQFKLDHRFNRLTSLVEVVRKSLTGSNGNIECRHGFLCATKLFARSLLFFALSDFG